MTEQALDVLMRSVLLDAIALECEHTDDEEELFVPSQQHQRRMRSMLKNPVNWSRRMAKSLWTVALQRAAVILLVTSISLAGIMAVSPTVRATVIRWVTEWCDSHVEILTEDNRFLIGKEIFNPNITVSSGDEWNEETDELEEEKTYVASITIPENPIIHSVANENCVPGSSIREIVLNGNRTPEIIIPNGAMGVFSTGDAGGWTCDSGDTITWKFEKYPMEREAVQTLGIGYVKDGVMHEMQAFRDVLSGEYKLTVQEKGIYHVYVIGLSSDPISVKESKIEIG